jgi:hypothetical protein
MRLSDIHKRVLAQESEKLLLDEFPNAASAFSLRKLRKEYAGFCIQVRRSSDNALQNIGFVDNALDTASLLSFVGAGNGFVRTWYDQSGSNRNAVATNNTIQPRIVNSGILETKNGKPTIFFNNSTLVASRALTSSNFSALGVIAMNTTQFSRAILAQHDGSASINRTIFLTTSPIGRSVRLFFNNGTNFNVITTNNYDILGNLDLFESHSDGFGNSKVYLNATGEGSLTGENWIPLNTNLTIGSLGNGGNPLFGHISEIIVYDPSQLANQTAIQTNINSFYNIYE